MSLKYKPFPVQVAFAAIDEVAKLQYVLTIKEIPTTEGRNAELALWRRRPDEAEAILLQVGLGRSYPLYRSVLSSLIDWRGHSHVIDW